MVAARSGIDLFNSRGLPEIKYDDIINAIDWRRVLIQAYGEHARVHGTEPHSICGNCIKAVLLRKDE